MLNGIKKEVSTLPSLEGRNGWYLRSQTQESDRTEFKSPIQPLTSRVILVGPIPSLLNGDHNGSICPTGLMKIKHLTKSCWLKV